MPEVLQVYESNIASPFTQGSPIPPQVESLAAREKELATAIYVHGAMTANALAEKLTVQLDNSSIRSMLGRLCRKGILTRRKRVLTSSCGRRIAFLYLPAIAPDTLRKSILKQVARDYFDGSLLLAVQTTIELMAEEEVVPATPEPRRRPPPKPTRVDMAA
ncbi:MAG TPA: BlaI/MecI/CopY family transcriptional regulator [Sphingomicrobium sp.]|nr:BlaI/MecI/CopY family transcriptional regulator [Sphingomicrobium sp.]